MSKIHQSMAALVLALVGLVGCDYETRAVGDANPARVAEMKQALRDLWVGHIFWVRHVVSNISTNDPAERGYRREGSRGQYETDRKYDDAILR